MLTKKLIVMVLFLVALPLMKLRGAENSGWTIFQRIESSQFIGNVLTSMGYSDLTSALYNPAVPAALHRKEWLFTSDIGSTNDTLGAVLYGQPIGDKCMLTVGAGYYNAGPVELNWIDNNSIQSQTVTLEQDMLSIVSFGYAMSKDFMVGVSFKSASSQVAQQQTAYAYVGDVGMLYLPLPNLSVSVAAQNIGSSTNFINQANALPTAGYAGIGYSMPVEGGLLLASAGVTYMITDALSEPEVGCEYDYKNISLNAGYRMNLAEYDMHVGITVVVNKIKFGYALIPGNLLGNTNRLTVTYSF
ncbi:MAG: hypothetical protein ABSH12_09730 [Endomicrobiales bacterium]|jgi:hypothetical protein